LGSAVFIYQRIDREVDRLQNIEMRNNTATIGGTIYWVKDTRMTEEPPGLYGNSTLFADNKAPYGEEVATQAVLIDGPGECTLMTQGTYDPPLAFTLTDHYDNVVINSYQLMVFSAKLSPGKSSYKCAGFPATVGGDNVFYRGGSVDFVDGSLETSCFPGGNLTLIIEGNIIALDHTVSVINMTTLLRYQECGKGTFIDISECTECPSGTYSLESTVTKTLECTPCTDVEGVEACWGSHIKLKDGYWRRSENHTEVLKCQYVNG
jgi:hypothetical protein